ncbi:DUF2975 domain-containing protein [Niallia nealsonii]|uniref:DUF2975 domain-containing protein n=1 Tax=Niallia nealsonii TaxID=115979 RepID=A0A2N0Z0A4_9BACI|nr:DUF2975 domain-containing protein [Niallia nealsonii]PKG22918.1 DUF2975 domain-containing protein [Niallia nealsonii]
MNQSTTSILKVIILMIGILVFALCIFFLPFLAKEAAMANPDYKHLKIPVLLGIYGTVVPFFTALYQTFKILHFIEKKNAFSSFAVTALGYIRNSAVIIVILYLIGVIFLSFQHAMHPGLAIIAGVVIFSTLMIALFAALLQELL